MDRRAGDGRRDPDIPEAAGGLGRLHAALGRMAIAAAVRLRRPVSLGVRLLALSGRGEVLLVRQSYMPGLVLPGGAVEPGETLRAAALREAAEETGVAIGSPPTLFHVYLNRALGARDHVALFVARDVRPGPAARRPGAEILWSGFCAADALPDDVTPATRARLDEVLGGAPPADFW